MNLFDYEPRRRPRMTRRVLRGFDAQAFAEARRQKGISVSDLSRLADVSQADALQLGSRQEHARRSICWPG